MSKCPVNRLRCSIASWWQSSVINWFIKTSVTRKNKCRLSITIQLSGMDENNGGLETLNFCLHLGSAAFSMFCSTVRAPLHESVTDHSLSGSNRSSRLHLHQIQAYVLLAASIPVIQARNFQSPPRKYSTSKILSSTLICFSFSTSFIMSSRAFLDEYSSLGS